MKRHLQTLVAVLAVCGMAIAAGPARGRFAPPGTSTADIISATGWTYNGTQSLSTGDIAIPTNSVIYLNGATRTQGFTYDGTNIKVLGVSPLIPASDQAINLGTTAIRWSNLFLGELNLGAGATRRTLIATTPTIAAACTSPTVTHGNTVSFQMDVGTGCAVSTVTLTLSAADNGWSCRGRHITSGATRYIEQTGAVSTTSVTMTNFVRTTGVAGNFADGDDLSIECMAR